MKLLKVLTPALLLLALLLAGCSTIQAQEPGGYLTGATLDEPGPGANQIFNITVAKVGDPIGIDFRGLVTSGTLSVQLKDASGKVVWQQTAGTGTFGMNQTMIAQSTGVYHLGLAWEGAVKATYNLRWQPNKIEAPRIQPVALLEGLGMLLVALGFIAYVGIRRLGWRYLLVGAGFWVLTVVLKLVWASAGNSAIYAALKSILPGISGQLIFDLYVGCLTGIFEVGLTYLLLQVIDRRRGHAPWRSALAFGIGFGAVEALLLGISPLVSVIVAMVSPDSLPFEALMALSVLNNPLWGAAGVVERFFTIWVHVGCNVLIFYAIAVRQPKWFWLSFAYKTLLDTIAAYIQVSGLTGNLGAIWMTEAIITLLGSAAWWYTFHVIAPRYPGEEELPIASPQPSVEG
jgi:uncharacterized membrane protein YhfC